MLIIITFWGILKPLSDDSAQFLELMLEIKYAANLVKIKKFNLGQYYNHMAGFFDYIDRKEDAEEHRVLAIKWKKEKGDKT